MVEETVGSDISEVAHEITSEMILEHEGAPPSGVPEVVDAPHDLAGQELYHTVSGGPETLHDLAVKNGTESATPVHPSTYSGVHPTTGGYSIPQPGHELIPTVEQRDYLGSIIFLGTMSVIGGVVGYLYFLLPSTFNEVFLAVLIVKNNLFGK